ncbi:MAG: DUF3795 domain-containing protein [Promethearchaeota archaeon]
MVKIRKELLSPCGLYCGVCAVYLAYTSNENGFKRKLFPVFEKWGAKTIEDIVCTGCLSDDVVFPFCLTCSIKKCVKDKNIESCCECDGFPCDIIENWPSLEGKQVIKKEIPIWREVGTEKWVEKVENRNMCPECGTINYRGARQCFKCQASINFTEI